MSTTTMIDEARAGWSQGAGGTTSALWSSEIWFGFRAGQVLKAEGLAQPVRIKMSRGYSVRVKPAGEPGRLIKFAGARLDEITVSIDYGA